MSIKLLHQVGHNSNWNRDSFEKDKIGTGLIYSPVHILSNKLKDLPKSLKETSIFDPQFYLPSSEKPKFKSYDFFPNTILGEQGFNTIDYNSVANESAKRCISFQVENNFKNIVIPARFYEQLNPKYTEQQSELFVSPFLNAIRKSGVLGTKEIYLTVPITSHMLNIQEYKTNILNWLTSYPEIDGVYFICQFDRPKKQIDDAKFLIEYMNVIRSTIEADLKVIVGYTNTEALLYSLAGQDLSLTIGAFENTRIFSLDKFVVSDEERRGPKARIYMPKLLNWINFEDAKLIKEHSPEVWDEIYTETDNSEKALKLTKSPTFNNPILYKHYFQTFSEQLNELSSLDLISRYELIKNWIQKSLELHKLIDNINIQLDKHGDDSHLIPWKNAIEIFKKNHL
ncbi:hypothetical protein SAMN04487870_2414 [Pseudoalteromonas sp. DSM 26666]|uniref:hypothetical protein n=1 Tax=Pseudoalteromonas sp. DSM 26666 TaxID=1761892 RepID=UPI0008E75426|nr:hypothetical protein [Pseudoalteromonas sp. DSM 26666]SFT92628.1 hypothetical protein SAMN04487870_2414 [Pseudoalteromonas sp. DSM 26666]